MALARHLLPSSFPLVDTLINPNCHFPKPSLFVRFESLKPFSVSAVPPTSTSHSSSPVILPFLQEGEEEDDLKSNPVQIAEKEDVIDDQNVEFFQKRSSAQDPCREAKFSFHLAEDLDSMEESESEVVGGFEEENEELGFTYPRSSVSVEGVPGEVLQIARNLRQDSTLGEVLGPVERRIGPMECLGVLELMGREGLVRGCLQFFEWMRMQKPSLVTPQACSILFLLLGRVRMGDELLVQFRNLPPTKQFRDVDVYNAAISGLLCCGRYNFNSLMPGFRHNVNHGGIALKHP